MLVNKSAHMRTYKQKISVAANLFGHAPKQLLKLIKTIKNAIEREKRKIKRIFALKALHTRQQVYRHTYVQYIHRY